MKALNGLKHFLQRAKSLSSLPKTWTNYCVRPAFNRSFTSFGLDYSSAYWLKACLCILHSLSLTSSHSLWKKSRMMTRPKVSAFYSCSLEPSSPPICFAIDISSSNRFSLWSWGVLYLACYMTRSAASPSIAWRRQTVESLSHWSVPTCFRSNASSVGSLCSQQRHLWTFWPGTSFTKTLDCLRWSLLPRSFSCS